MRVQATQNGYYDHVYQVEGSVFELVLEREAVYDAQKHGKRPAIPDATGVKRVLPTWVVPVANSVTSQVAPRPGAKGSPVLAGGPGADDDPHVGDDLAGVTTDDESPL